MCTTRILLGQLMVKRKRADVTGIAEKRYRRDDTRFDATKTKNTTDYVSVKSLVPRGIRFAVPTAVGETLTVLNRSLP